GGQPGGWSFRRRRGAGGRKEKEASDPSNSPGSAESESCSESCAQPGCRLAAAPLGLTAEAPQRAQ
ncbi:unnamed protein product, partial [Bubo scandiacus]